MLILKLHIIFLSPFFLSIRNWWIMLSCIIYYLLFIFIPFEWEECFRNINSHSLSFFYLLFFSFSLFFSSVFLSSSTLSFFYLSLFCLIYLFFISISSSLLSFICLSPVSFILHFFMICFFLSPAVTSVFSILYSILIVMMSLPNLQWPSLKRLLTQMSQKHR